MKKTIMIFITGLLGVSSSSLADEAQAKKLTVLQLRQIAWAIKILGETKTLSTTENQCVSFDQDILSLLEAEGQIQNGDVHPTTVCFGGGPGAASATK
nr:hypothetical protein HAGR004_03090 [Bdellovibrio sp. HAGR004]